ncbi:JAB domain-containing protein [Halalkalibacter alkalisediminis]|uniref:RadC family protein n=1 Tax=Halalkalibacter alkalisediminis TaxID=935616 RepID=A0ABV6NJ75_9BACI|nr:JAB domain-containing protein [Halalkalibacter alkalisediminis]
MEPVFEVVRIRQEIRDLKEDYARHKVGSPADAAELATKVIGDEDREVFLVMMLNTKNQVVGLHRCHVGSLNASIVHPREVMKSAILNNAASIIVSHQHPSGQCDPSREDIDVTKRLAEAGRIIGIELLDHVIVNYKGDFYSMRENAKF